MPLTSADVVFDDPYARVHFKRWLGNKVIATTVSVNDFEKAIDLSMAISVLLNCEVYVQNMKENNLSFYVDRNGKIITRDIE